MRTNRRRAQKWYNPTTPYNPEYPVHKSFHLFIILIIFPLLVSGCLVETGMPTAVLETEPDPTLESFPILTPTTAPTETPTSLPTDVPIPAAPVRTVLAFTGVIVPARCVQAGIDARGSADYLYENVREILSGADLTIGVYNATMRSGVPYIGCERSWELIGSPINADAMKAAGFDLVSVATNHIKDCGKQPCGDAGFFETLENFNRVGIATVGAGPDLAAAMDPVVIEVHGVRYGFVSLGEVNERVFAGFESPGIAPLTSANLEAAIQVAKEQADIVIVLPHSGPEDYPEVTPQQNYWARYSVEYGADLVVITHAHILQGYHRISGVPVFYSLGNFVFDQVWARDHQQGAILLVTFEKGKVVGFEFLPTIAEQDGAVSLAEGEEREEILALLEALSADLEE